MGADPTIDLVSSGEEALVAGDWEGARLAFAAALHEEPSPAALDGFGRTLWWLGDVDGAIEHRERAYAILRKAGESTAAAKIALWLSREYLEAVGNQPASNGWIARAEGLLRDTVPGPEHGWLG
jgi:tetratricopeptide (TPR) repeat protein